MTLVFSTDSHRQRIISWIDATGQISAAFDFTTKGILQVSRFFKTSKIHWVLLT